MAVVNWLIGFDGDWSIGTNWWSGGTYHLPGATDNVFIRAPGTYTVTLSTTQSVKSLTLDAAGATFVQQPGATLALTADLVVSAGTAILSNYNSILGDTYLGGGLLKVGNNDALGAGKFYLSGGELLATSNVTLNGQWDISNNVVVAAAHGKTLNAFVDWTMESHAALTFGAPGANGVVVWGLPAAISDPYTVDVAAGTLRSVGNGLDRLLFNAAETTVEAGATIDISAADARIGHLQGSGTITDKNAGRELDLGTSNFSGVIAGAIYLRVNGVDQSTLTGDSHYTGGTTIYFGATLILGAGGSTGSITGPIRDNGKLVINHSNVFSLDNVISGSMGSLELKGTGTTTINHANTFGGGTMLFAGIAAFGDGGAFGTRPISIVGGELLATANETIVNDIIGVAPGVIAAAHGKTLTIDNTWTMQEGSAITFGATGQDGTVIASPSGGLSIEGNYFLDVANGTLKAGGNSFSNLTTYAHTTTVDAGAKLDINGVNVMVENLLGGGTVTDSGASTLTLDSGNFSGSIAGPLALNVAGPTILKGGNTYSGGTTITANGALSLGGGGKTGSVTGHITDNGVLIFNHSKAFTVANVISGSGNVEQVGSGVTTLTKANSYSAQTFVLHGTLASTHGGAFGTGHIHLRGGELLASTSQTISNVVATDGNGTIAAAHGKTATLTGAFNINLDHVNTVLTFGAAGANGIVQLKPSSVNIGNPYDVVVAAGTLKAGNFAFTNVTQNAVDCTVSSGAKLDLAGLSSTVHGLKGGGTVTSATFAALDIQSGNFAGNLTGKLEVDVHKTVTLSGALSFQGTLYIEPSANFTFSGTGAEKFTFGGNNAKLILPNSATYTGKISNFAQTDKIDLTGIAFSAGSHFTFNATTDVLHVIHGSHTANLHFVDGYVASDFKIGNDGHGHTLVTTTSAGHFDAHEDELFDTAALVVPFLPETMLLELGLG